MRVQTSMAVLNRATLNVSLVISLAIASFTLDSHTAFATVSQPTSALQTQLLTAQQNISRKNYKQALQIAESILSDAPNQFSAQFIRAQALGALGKTDQAVESYEVLLKTESKPTALLPELYNNLATLYAKQGRLELARQTLEDGIATNKKYKTLYENLSAVYVEMARGAYSKALNLGVKVKVVQLKNLSLEPVHVASVEQNNNQALAQATQVAMHKPDEKMVSETSAPEATPKMEPKVEPKVEQVAQVKNVKKVETVAMAKPMMKTEFSQKQAPQINKEEVITALHGWAAAWSAQSVDLYLSFYGENFKPVKLSKEVWAVQRRIRLNKPRWVNVRLKDFSVQPTHNDKAIVQLVQDYRADNYHDKTKKQFVMQRTVDGWRILSEKSLAVIQ